MNRTVWLSIGAYHQMPYRTVWTAAGAISSIPPAPPVFPHRRMVGLMS